METYGKTLIGTSLALLSGGLAHAADKSDTPKNNGRPNIVLIIADDCRYLDLGCYGSPDSKTPNIDKIAEQGLKFERFFQATAMSSATRHCLLTGLYPVRSGAYPNHTMLNEGVQTLPTYLKEAGYRVAMQGKRHFAPLKAFPFEYLTDEKQMNIYPEVIDAFFADASKKDQPFFLYVGTTDPHTPWTHGDQSQWKPEELTMPSNLVDTPFTRTEFRNYLAEINKLDSDVGQIDSLLHHYGLADNTVFIFTSEQGYSFPFAKWTCYNEGLHTGVVVRWPGVIKPGSTTPAMCEYVDIAPTLVDIAGGKIPEGLDGKSILPVIKGKTDKMKKYVYAAHTTRGIYGGSPYYGIRAVRSDKFNYIVNLTPEATFNCLATHNKIFQTWQERAKTDDFAKKQTYRFQHRPAEELYDIIADPFETHNLADDPRYAKVKKELKGKLQAWMEQQGDKGQETEMEAYDHMPKHQKNKGKN